MTQREYNDLRFHLDNMMAAARKSRDARLRENAEISHCSALKIINEAHPTLRQEYDEQQKRLMAELDRED